MRHIQCIASSYYDDYDFYDYDYEESKRAKQSFKQKREGKRDSRPVPGVEFCYVKSGSKSKSKYEENEEQTIEVRFQ